MSNLIKDSTKAIHAINAFCESISNDKFTTIEDLEALSDISPELKLALNVIRSFINRRPKEIPNNMTMAITTSVPEFMYDAHDQIVIRRQSDKRSTADTTTKTKMKRTVKTGYIKTGGTRKIGEYIKRYCDGDSLDDVIAKTIKRFPKYTGDEISLVVNKEKFSEISDDYFVIVDGHICV